MVKKALTALKVLDLGQFISGPFCAKTLGDLGADVIKVEPSEGDEARKFGPFLNSVPHPERSGLFLYLNTNKKGITLNVSTAAGKKLLKQLVEKTDILIENSSPGTMKKLGLDYDSLKEINPKLIMTSITPFGQTGPYKNYKSSDLVMYNMSGSGNVTPLHSTPDQEPLKTGGHLTDFYAGISAATATMCAVHNCKKTGRGQHVDVSCLEAFINMIWAFFTGYQFENDALVRYGKVAWAPIAVLPCKDGYVSFQFQEEHQWSSLMEIMGNPDWAENELFKDQWARAENWDACSALMIDWLKDQEKESFFHMAQANRCPVAPVNTMEDALRSEHLTERKFFVEVDSPETGKVKYPSAPYKFSKTPWIIDQPAPTLGQHNEEIYCNRLGYAKQDLVRMRTSGAI